MPESKQHIDLVKRILSHIITVYSDKNLFILNDLPGENTDNRPPLIQNYIPDVFAHNPITGFTIIGEAKTVNDIEVSHTAKQIKEFVNYLSYNEGVNYFLLSVPFQGRFSAQRLLNRFLHKNVKLSVLDGMNSSQ